MGSSDRGRVCGTEGQCPQRYSMFPSSYINPSLPYSIILMSPQLPQPLLANADKKESGVRKKQWLILCPPSNHLSIHDSVLGIRKQEKLILLLKPWAHIIPFHFIPADSKERESKKTERKQAWMRLRINSKSKIDLGLDLAYLIDYWLLRNDDVPLGTFEKIRRICIVHPSPAAWGCLHKSVNDPLEWFPFQILLPTTIHKICTTSASKPVSW